MNLTARRCKACAAPLPLSSLTCGYCGCDHVMDSGVEGVLRASAEAKDIAAWVREREPVLQRELQELQERIAKGERSLIPEALRIQEGLVRLIYAPTLHIYAQMPDQPTTVEALATIEVTIAQVVENWRQALEGSDQTGPTTATFDGLD